MKKHFCDLCGKEINKDNWEDFGDVEIKITQSCSNPLADLRFSNQNYQRAEIKIDELCSICVRKISKSVKDALSGILC